MRRRIRSAAFPVHRHSVPQLVVDGLLVALAYFLAFRLRFERLAVPPRYEDLFEATIPWVVPVSLVVLASFGLFASFVLVALLITLRRRRGRGSRFSLAVRLTGVATLFVFTLSGCVGQGVSAGLGMQEGYVITLDPLHDPAVGTYFYHHNHINSSSVITESGFCSTFGMSGRTSRVSSGMAVVA